jgi:predicted TIM-barrel fold metal-dependent hydrolase
MKRFFSAFGLLFCIGLSSGCFIIDGVGGAFSYEPEELDSGLSPAAKELVQRAFSDVNRANLADYHVHLAGMGAGGTGNWVNPKMSSLMHPGKRMRYSVYLSAGGIDDMERADQQYVERLVRLVRHGKGAGKFHILAFDHHYELDGTIDEVHTEFYVPNDYAYSVAQKAPDIFVPVISVHPYRKDAVEELEKWAAKGVRLIKWLPNAMGIDPSHPRCDPFYAAMRRLDMVLLTHAGEEKAVEAEADQLLGNPLHLRRPLDQGTKIIVAHCASRGQNPDFEAEGEPLVDNFDLFMRLIDEPKYEGLLFGDISALTLVQRMGKPLRTLLERDDVHHRLVDGSDYPLPAINILIHTGKFVDQGYIRPEEEDLLNEVYEYNPLLFDYVLKRTLRSPKTGKPFAANVFELNPGLAPKSENPSENQEGSEE